MRRSALLFFCAFLSLLFVVSPAWAQLQEDISFAVAKIIADPEVVDGDIVSINLEGEIVRANNSFDPLMYGIVTDTGTIVYYPTEEGTPILRGGIATVNATTLTGDIEPGDYVTSSPIAGKAQKTNVQDGWIVGIALTGLTEGDGQAITFEERQLTQGTIQVSLVLGPAIEGTAGDVSRLVDQIGSVLLANVQTPSGTNSFFRFLLAALIAIAAIAIGFGSFGRNITRGIEAIGRNPLAKRQIQAMIILNIFLIALISLAGIILALAIVRY
jgi:hypothetical protein